MRSLDILTTNLQNFQISRDDRAVAEITPSYKETLPFSAPNQPKHDQIKGRSSSNEAQDSAKQETTNRIASHFT